MVILTMSATDISARNYKSCWLITSSLGQKLAVKEVHRPG